MNGKRPRGPRPKQRGRGSKRGLAHDAVGRGGIVRFSTACCSLRLRVGGSAQTRGAGPRPTGRAGGSPTEQMGLSGMASPRSPSGEFVSSSQCLTPSAELELLS